MKQKLVFTLALAILVTGAFAQKVKKSDRFTSAKKGSLFGLHFNLADFKTPVSIKETSLNDALKQKDWKKVSAMSGGFSFSYWKGLTKTIDFSTKLNVMFHDYAAIYDGVAGKTEVGLEIEPTLNFRPMNDNHLFSPFITAGVGGGIYTGKIGLYSLWVLVYSVTSIVLLTCFYKASTR